MLRKTAASAGTSDDYLKELLARLDKGQSPIALADSPGDATAPTAGSVAAAAAFTPVPDEAPAGPAVAAAVDDRLESLRQQISVLTDRTTAAEGVTSASSEFMPLAPESLASARLTDSQVSSLILKFLLNQINASGREVAEHISLPFALINKLLSQLKADHLVVHKGSAPVADFFYQLTSAGLEVARRHFSHCSYFGAAPVHLDDYIASVHAQSVTSQQPTCERFEEVFADLLVNKRLANQVGQAIFAGQAFFLYGPPGNGKTSIAERVTRAFGPSIWLPRAIEVDGEIVRVYDPCKHTQLEVPAETVDRMNIDRRWVRIKRPTLVVGGELTMDQLEITRNTATGISEAPLQMKSNCGTLVIDDFGRQRIGIAELLNRWIVPLDRRFDFLNLASGKTIQVPFDQLLIFSTNLEPRDLVDEAFLRRIPYKIEVFSPTEEEFRNLFAMYAERLGLELSEPAVDYLIENHYGTGRQFRFCHARDLLLHVRNYCQFNKLPVEMTPETFDIAVRNYFAVMG